MNKNPAIEKSIPNEFTERVASLFLICIEGLRSEIPEDERLNTELNKLSQVIKKVISSQKKTDLGREIQDHFNTKKLESNFRELEKEDIKQIVFSMASAIKDISGEVGGYSQSLEKYIEKIESSENLKDILEIKDLIIRETKNVIANNEPLKVKLESSRRTALDLSRKIEQQKSKNLVDPLTKILNRSAYTMRIQQLLREFHRGEDPTGFIIADVDHLREFNDNHGREAGDKVLRSIASCLQEAVPRSNPVFRYDGEEFVVILNKANLEQTEKVAEKIRSQIEKDYYVKKNVELKVTVSLGVTGLKEGDTEISLLERANQALSLAKQNGGNRIEVGDSQYENVDGGP